MISFIYVVLHLVTWYCLYISGKRVQRSTDENYWKAARLGIIAFTLNEGLRWGRMIDYNNYYYFLQDVHSGHRTFEPIFQILCLIVGWLHIPYELFIVFTSFLLIVAIFYLMRSFRDVAPYALPLIAILTEQGTENFIRWFVGFSFMLIFFFKSFEQGKKRTRYIILSLIFGIGTHAGLVLLPAILYAISFIKKPMMHPVLSLSVFTAITFLFQTEFMLNFVSIFNLFNFNIFEGYQNNIEYWLTGGAGSSSTILGIYLYIYLIPVIIIGYYVAKDLQNQNYNYAYNLCLLALFLRPISRQIELINRFCYIFIIFEAIVAAYVFYHSINKTLQIPYIVRCLVILCFINFARVTVLAPFEKPEYQLLYVWNKTGEIMDNEKTWLYDIIINDNTMN